MEKDTNSTTTYSLTEVAYELDVSPSWINDVQRKTGICKKQNSQGKKIEMTEEEITLLEKVRVLRILGYNFKEIKTLMRLKAMPNRVAEKWAAIVVLLFSNRSGLFPDGRGIGV
jgi:DNA-binding transcriptional MerR regulator